MYTSSYPIDKNSLWSFDVYCTTNTCTVDCRKIYRQIVGLYGTYGLVRSEREASLLLKIYLSIIKMASHIVCVACIALYRSM